MLVNPQLHFLGHYNQQYKRLSPKQSKVKIEYNNIIESENVRKFKINTYKMAYKNQLHYNTQMKTNQVKTLLIFLLVCSTINAGPAYPACAALCALQCTPVLIGYPICIAACLALCVGTCFSADTLVTTLINQETIQVPISKIETGDYVLTDTGFSRVISNQKIAQLTQFLKITFNDNSIVEVTPNHPIMNSSWIPVKLLEKQTLDNKKEVIKIESIEKNQRFFILTESGTIIIAGCKFGAFHFYDQNYELAHREWIALFE